jgi:hypothetical protein
MAELVTKTDLAASVASIEAKVEAQTLRLTVRLGGLMSAPEVDPLANPWFART